ncbi:MAG: hypothetical protein M3460_10910 [Actinomycetota bacterium]|nr:hypothetical protein [Actinomycetota bacterium]
MAPNSRPPGDNPLEELGPVAALARQVERNARATATLEELLRGLAGDVAALVANAPTQHPAPASWLLTIDPGEALETLEWLTRWVRDVYLWYPEARLPSCWMWHPAAIEELWWLAQAHREAYTPPTRSISKACEWHDRFRPGVVKRLNDAPYRDCDLSRHAADADRFRTMPADSPLHSAARRIATEWIDGQHIPEPTPLEQSHANAIDRAK